MKGGALILMGVILIGLIFAIPSIPHGFSGYVKYSGNPSASLVGQQITATVGGSSVGVVGQVQAGNYYETGVDSQGKSGTVRFYVGGVEATPTLTYVSGGESFVNLTINELPSGVICGNNILESGEQCDRVQLGGATCESVVGISGTTGTLSCTSSCTYDLSDCNLPICGDGVIQSNEQCDDGNTNSGDGCSNTCIAEATSGNGGGSGGGGGGGGNSNSQATSNKAVQDKATNPTIKLESESNRIPYINEDNSNENSPGITGAVVGFVKSGAGIGFIVVLLIITASVIVLIKRK